MTVADDVYTMERLEDVLKRDQTTFETIEIDFSAMWNEARGAYQYQRSIRVSIHNLSRMLWFTTCKGELLNVVYSSGGVDINISAEQFSWGAPSDWDVRTWIAQMAKELMP
jgi:hypothetical protein